MKAINKQPKIRFKGFTDAWEQCELCEIASKVSEKNKNRLYDETFTNSAEYGVVSQLDFFEHDVSKKSSLSGYYVVRENDFIYNPRISINAPVGPINRNRLGRAGVMSPLYTVMRTNNVDNTYLEYYFKTKFWHKFMRFNGDSGARSDRFTIKMNLFFEMLIPRPEIREQQKIGEYFESLDKSITLHQRKCEELKLFKKAMLAKMFPKEGEGVPEVRFSGFKENWKDIKLACVLNEYYEKYENDGTYEHVSLTQLGVVPKTDRYNRESLVREKNKKYRITNKNDICYNPANLKFGVICRNKYKKSIFSPIYITFKVCEQADPVYVEYYLKRESFIKEALKKQEGTVFERMSVKPKDLLDMIIKLPNIEEQYKIGSYFKHLDDMINLHQQKVENLQNIKKSLLDNMFV